MEESSVEQCEENKAVPEKIRGGRQFKSREQLQGLENFYNEHTYPNDSMKTEIAINLNLTEKQVSGWFCHRRLKDKRLLDEEIKSLQQKPDISSSIIIQDHATANGLKQDSCSSTGPHLREVETERARVQVGPSGYLKIKGLMENAAITAVKRQLGRYYREDGPSLVIEFDPLPPEGFESPNTNFDDAYEYLPNSNPNNFFAFHQPKQKSTFPNHYHQSYGGKIVGNPMNVLPVYNHVDPKIRPSASANRANKRTREEVLQEDRRNSTSQDAAPWSKQIKGLTEMPSSFSEDETAETSSSMDGGL